MAKKSKIIESRNGCNILWVEEEIESAGRGAKKKKFGSFSVRAKTGRIVETRITSLEKARAIADQQPPAK